MKFLRFTLLVAGVLSLSATLFAGSEPMVNDEFVHKQFGDNCSMIGMASIKADLDGDGVEDIVIPARCKKPMMDQAEQSYTVVDPYDAFFGYSNPKITTQFASEDPARRGFSLLIIHGVGADSWYAATPKAKFLIVNLPFRDIYVKKIAVKKKDRMAIYVEETGGDSMSSVLVWDGKKYRYSPLGSNME